MKLEQRIKLLVQLGAHLTSEDEDWQRARNKAFGENNWFLPEFVDLAARNIASQFLQESQLRSLAATYELPEEHPHPKTVGIVMAGNIPLVGFHDLLCSFISGHYSRVKPSSKDEALIRHIIDKLISWDAAVATWIQILPLLKNCDAYIATGSTSATTHFEYYFRNYKSIIRSNRTSVAILTGNESTEDLEHLADDVYLYFGLGCRNITKIFVPKGYRFEPLLEAFRKYDYLAQHNKYKNNYDYNLAIHLLNNKYYMTNGSILLVEDPSPFSPISQLHYEYYTDRQAVMDQLQNNAAIQCISGAGKGGFGKGQAPGICDFADGVDTMQFLKEI